MSAFSPLLGDRLLRSGEEVSTASALEGKTVALYFSAQWCEPCKTFTPKVIQAYNEHLKAKGLEVVFVSSDNDQASFDEYFGEMPWLALPFSERMTKDKLTRQFQVRGIPSLVILDSSGALITRDGRAGLACDLECQDFPWRPQTLKRLLRDAKFVNKEGTEFGSDALEGKVLGLYFSAHWCPPCKHLTPKLANWYTTSLKDKGLEVVFVSYDQNQESFNTYFSEMPWLALEYQNRKLKEILSNKLMIEGVPTLVLVDPEGFVITREGRGAATSDPEGKNFPWLPKPVLEIAEGPGLMEFLPTVVAFCEASDAASVESMEAVLSALARDYIKRQRDREEDLPDYSFMIAREAGGHCAKLRPLVRLQPVPPKPHEHPLEKKEDTARGWTCDGCNKQDAPERYRCMEGCDFDFCGECHVKAGQAGSAEPPKLYLLDLNDDGAYYEFPEGEVSEANVRKWLTAYEEFKLEKKTVVQES